MPDFTPFNKDKFISSVIADMEVKSPDDPRVVDLRWEIEGMLAERILSTVIDFMKPEDVKKYEHLLKEDSERTDYEAVMEVAEEMEGIEPALEKAVTELYDELTYGFRKIKEKMVQEKMDSGK